MNLHDAVNSIIKPHKEDVLFPLTTPFAENFDKKNVKKEYPRPQLVRDSYQSLNGEWDYAITGTDTVPANFQGKILVPFSPEAALSGVNRQLQPEEYLWYRTTISIAPEELLSKRRLILHFGAVDYLTVIYLNGKEVLTNEGGYLPFSCDITSYLTAGSNALLVRVQDFTDVKSQARGKQSLQRGGIFYTAQSGIWQSVWMEWVENSYIKNMHVTADYDSRRVRLSLLLHTAPDSNPDTAPSDDEGSLLLSMSAYCNGQDFASQSLTIPIPAFPSAKEITATLEFSVPDSCFHPWSPETPFLYDLKISFGKDCVSGYFAMRCFSVEKHSVDGGDALPVFCLNHKPYFLMGVLDQGYWPEGLYTAPSDEALVYDITAMKNLGFNLLRKHSKTEDARWYYHCDRLGMIVCQDMVNGGSAYHMPVISYLPTLFPQLSKHIKDRHYTALSRKDKSARLQWEKECLKTIESLSDFPSIAIWTVFNEGWGQFDTERITSLIQEKDPHRLIDSASGWFDQGCGNFISVHNYFRPLSVPVRKWKERAFFLSEYGGYACHVKGHSSLNRAFGYKRYETAEEFQAAYGKLIQKSLLPLRKQGLSGAVFTQLSDIEEEVNGILTYDRKINKLLPQHPA